MLLTCEGLLLAWPQVFKPLLLVQTKGWIGLEMDTDIVLLVDGRVDMFVCAKSAHNVLHSCRWNMKLYNFW